MMIGICIGMAMLWVISICVAVSLAADNATVNEYSRLMMNAVAHGVAEVILNKDGKPTFRWRTFNESDVR